MWHGVLRWLGGTMLGLLAAAASADLVRSVEVAPGNHVLIGSRNEASRQNHGEVGNLGFIVGDDAVLVVNAGTSYAHGRQLLARVAEEAPGRRMAMLVLTQPLPEFVLGAAAFSDQGVPVVADEAAARLLSQRCEQCLENLRALLGDEAMVGTRVVAPDRPIAADTRIELGTHPVELIAPGWSSAPGDLMVFDRRAGVLFSGAVVTERRIPEVRDARLDAWRETLARIATLSPRLIVPGYGAPGDTGLLKALDGYLATLERFVEARLNDGASLQETINAAETDAAFLAYRDWAGYPAIHRRNVHHRYLELEARSFRY